MNFLRKTIALSTAICALMTVAGCSVERELDDQLTRNQTKQRAGMLIPSNTLFGVELRSVTGLPACESILTEQKPTCSDGESIHLQASEIPTMLDRPYLLVIWDAESRVQSILAVTKLSWKEQSLKTLIGKYGKPDFREPHILLGDEHWQWTFKDAKVTYYNNGHDVTVALETSEQDRRDQARFKKEIEDEVRQEALKRSL